jgi:hypothetical protein
MNQDEATVIVGLALAAYPSQASRIGEKSIAAMRAMWADLLDDLEFGVVKAALQVHCRSNKWLPSPAELRDLVAGGGAAVRSGMDAWGDVLRAVCCYGIHRVPEFGDPLVADAVKAVGWDAICNSENQVADRAHFARVYDSMATAARTAAQVGARAVHQLRGMTSPTLAVDLAKVLTSGDRRLGS